MWNHQNNAWRFHRKDINRKVDVKDPVDAIFDMIFWDFLRQTFLKFSEKDQFYVKLHAKLRKSSAKLEQSRANPVWRYIILIYPKRECGALLAFLEAKPNICSEFARNLLEVCYDLRGLLKQLEIFLEF